MINKMTSNKLSKLKIAVYSHVSVISLVGSMRVGRGADHVREEGEGMLGDGMKEREVHLVRFTTTLDLFGRKA